MEDISLLTDVIYSPKHISKANMEEISHSQVLNNLKQKNTNQDKSHHIMALVLKKILFKMFTDLILKDLKKISSSGWTNKLSLDLVLNLILILKKIWRDVLLLLTYYMMIIFLSMNQKLETQELKEVNS
jgi:hypothetical protein